MAGIKISEATLRQNLKGTENVPIVDSDLLAGRTTMADIKNFVKPDLSEYLKKEDVQDINIEDLIMYGIEFDVTVSSPDCTRIGNTNLHRDLPVHSLMKGCLLADDGSVVKYLDHENWTSETRDGSLGQVMVEVPEHYIKFETDGNKRRVKLSITPIAGYKKINKYYVSAYKASLQRSTSKLASVVNMDEDYRGGNNNTAWDGTYRTLLGKPATAISRTNFRTYARNRNLDSDEWNCMVYTVQKDLYWLFAIEYATLNTQKAYNASKDSNGYAQGGLGNGVTTLSDSNWGSFNGYYPLVPCGVTDSLGNRTGIVQHAIANDDSSITHTFDVPRYRGIESPFGDIWQWTDGINVRISPTSDNGGDDLSMVYICEDPSKFNDNNYEGYTYVGNEARSNGYVKEVIFEEGGEIMPSVVGGGSTTYFCDYHYTNIPTTEALRGVLFGGSANNGASAGFVFASSAGAPSASDASIGSRLCFIPANS